MNDGKTDDLKPATTHTGLECLHLFYYLDKKIEEVIKKLSTHTDRCHVREQTTYCSFKVCYLLTQKITAITFSATIEKLVAFTSME